MRRRGGPWDAGRWDRTREASYLQASGASYPLAASLSKYADAAFAAAARDAVPRLIAALRESRRQIDELHNMLNAQIEQTQQCEERLRAELDGKTKLLAVNSEAYAHIKGLLDRYEPVVAAAKEWHEFQRAAFGFTNSYLQSQLFVAVDALLAAEKAGKP